MDEETKEGESADRVALNVAELRAIRALGKGATSRVYLCEHGTSRRHFALKKISKSEAMKNRSVAIQAKREREALLLLEETGEKPFLARFYGACKDSDWLYYILEYVGGGPLSAQLKNYGKLANGQVEVYIAQMILAVRHLHKLSIVHRDIKANNVLLCEGGQQVKLIDFGRAKLLPKCSCRTDTFLGVAHHTAPEAARKGSDYGPQVDWWALGILCFELAFGKPPVPYLVRDPSEILSLNVEAVLQKQIVQVNGCMKGFMIAALKQKPEQRDAALNESTWFLDADANAQRTVEEKVMYPEKGVSPKEADDPFKDF